MATAKGISLSNNICLYGYDTFLWSCAKFFNKKDIICSFIKFREKYFIKKFDKNLNSISNIEKIAKDEIIRNYNDQFKVIPKNLAKYFDEKILELDNINIVDLDHNQLESLHLKHLLEQNLIKPLYLS